MLLCCLKDVTNELRELLISVVCVIFVVIFLLSVWALLIHTMTTIRRPPRRRQGMCASRCAMFGLSIITLIVLHLLAVAFLYQRVPSENTHSLRSETMDSVLKRSIDSLTSQQEVQKQWFDKPQGMIVENKERPQVVREKKDKESPEEEIPDNPNDAEGLDDDKQDEKEDRGGDEAEVIEEKIRVDSPDVEEKGSRVTDTAYIGDLFFAREHPSFRTHEIVLPQLDERVQSLNSCGYISNHRLLTHAACHQGNVPFTAYNHQPFPRTWCGKVIAPNSVERFDDPCHEPVRLFPTKDAPVSGEGMPPVVITSNKGNNNVEDVTCDIPCQQQVGMDGLTRFIEGTEWKITTTPGDPFSVKEAKIEGNAFRNDKYYSTASFSSSVPLSPFSFENYNLTVDAVDFDDTLPSASYLVDSACSSQGSKRHRWVGAVEKHFPVAYYGSCNHNTDLPDGMSLNNKEDRVQLHRKHRFNLAFESSNEKDYMTEVIFDAFQSGSLPVILGPSNIESHFPPHSFINAGSFQYWDQLGQYVKEVAENKTLWESYHEWRKDPDALQAFRERFAFTRTDPVCRMCRWAYAKQYGLGWNHIQQVVQETALPRSLCIDSTTSLVTSPFVESYVTKVEASYSAKNSNSCDGNERALHSAFSSKGFQLERSVEAHDGVTDLIIDNVSRPNTEGDFILRLEFGVKNVDGSFFRNPHTLVSTVRGPLCTSVAIQDERSKVTVIANWETEVVSTKEGVIEVVVGSGSDASLQEDEIRRIRVIVEDTSFIHDKVTEYYPSSYGKLMIQDAVDPLELFYDTN